MLIPPTRLGLYEILAPLGAGGMGEVYRARDTRLGRDIAVKVLPQEVASSIDRLARFEREAKTVASLNHPNIVTLYSIEEIAGTRIITMELVEGRSLADVVTPGGLPLTHVLDLAIPLSEALVAAHEKGIVHRDLKPANVMVTREGRVKVLDFGLAKLTHPEPILDNARTVTMKTPVSRVGEVVGTAPYMAPEQIRGEAVDGRTDLFSFGILVYELASGSRPFAGETFADLSTSILRDTPVSLVSLRSDLPADLDRIIGRCLEKRPRERFQTSLDVLNELGRLKRSLERGAPLAAIPAPSGVASIAVLPFLNRSASADDEYFSDGLADELLNVLAKIRGLRVAARTSAFHFKGKDTTIAEVGKALNVATILEGSVRKAGQRVRISVQLVKVVDGYHLWSETYDRMLDDIFAVQDDIAQSVVKELRATLLGEEADSKASGEVKAEVSKAVRGRGANSEAHRLFLQARYLAERHNRANVEKAIEYLKQALELDPGFALGWAELGWLYGREADSGWASVAEGYERAREAAKRALALDPDLAEGHSAMAWVQLFHDWDWDGAEISFRRALELASGNSSVLLRRAAMLERVHCRFDEAIELYHRALDQDPLSAAAYHNLGLTLYTCDRHVEAEAAFRKSLELSQRNLSRSALSISLVNQGRGQEALTEAAAEPDEVFRTWALAIIHHTLGDRAASESALQQLIEKNAGNSALQIAEIHGARGELDAAFEWLERAYVQRDSGLAEVKSLPCLRSLHSDPRWSGFLKKMRLAE